MELTHGPLLGAVTDRSIKVWVRGDREGSFLVRMWPTAEPEAERCSTAVGVNSELDLTGVARLDELEPATSYTYRIEAAGDDACSIAVSDEASFRTLPKEGEPARIRFAVGADVENGFTVPGFANIAEVEPDFVLMIGDNVYADGDGRVPGDFDATFARYQALYQRVWSGPQFRSLFSQVPVFMIWDDHELMENYWRGSNDLVYDVGRTLYDSYQGSHNPDPIHPRELYYTFRAGDIAFFVFDTRTHRDGNMEPDDADKSMLGDAQRQAFEQWLSEDDSKVHVIVSSVIVGDFTTTWQDPWTSFSVERNALLDVLAEDTTPNTFVISGDQHWSAILHIEHGELSPYSLYEFQTTPLGSCVREAPMSPNETMLALDNAHLVFGVFDIDTRVDPPLLDFTLCAVGEPCAPHEEPPPMTLDIEMKVPGCRKEISAAATHVATVPYSVYFEGSDRGFVMLPTD